MPLPSFTIYFINLQHNYSSMNQVNVKVNVYLLLQVRVESNYTKKIVDQNSFVLQAIFTTIAENASQNKAKCKREKQITNQSAFIVLKIETRVVTRLLSPDRSGKGIIKIIIRSRQRYIASK